MSSSADAVPSTADHADARYARALLADWGCWLELVPYLALPLAILADSVFQDVPGEIRALLWALFFVTGLGWLLNRRPLMAALFLSPRLAGLTWILWDAAHSDRNGSCVGAQCDDGTKMLIGAGVVLLIAAVPILSAAVVLGRGIYLSPRDRCEIQ